MFMPAAKDSACKPLRPIMPSINFRSRRWGSSLPGLRTRDPPLGPFIVATYVYASSQGQRTHSARTKILSTIAWVEITQLIHVNHTSGRV